MTYTMENALKSCSKLNSFIKSSFNDDVGIDIPKTKKEWNKVLKDGHIANVEDGADLAGDLYMRLRKCYRWLDFSTKEYTTLKAEFCQKEKENEDLKAELEKLRTNRSEINNTAPANSKCNNSNNIAGHLPIISIMTPEQFDQKSKIVIGNLLAAACPLSKTVISAFNHNSSYSANINTLKSSKFLLESLEACAVFLDISLSDSQDNRIFTKETLAKRIVLGLFALLPSTCPECDEVYTVDLEPDVKPFFECFKCFRGSHTCESLREKHKALNVIQLPSGMKWLCKACLDSVNPVVPRKSKSRFTSSVSKAGSRSTKTPPPAMDSRKGSVDSEEGRQKLKEGLDKLKRDQEKANQKQSSNVCEKYRVGQCPHGIRGNKLVDRARCNKQHPKRCIKYTRFGNKGKYGCKQGDKCKYYHPVLCKHSVREKNCTKINCPFPHLVGTIRPPKTDTDRSPKPKTSQKPVNGSKKKLPNNTKSTDKSEFGTNHFLEVQKMVAEMKASFQQELATVKSTLCHHLLGPIYPTPSNPQQLHPTPQQLHPAPNLQHLQQLLQSTHATPQYSY